MLSGVLATAHWVWQSFARHTYGNLPLPSEPYLTVVYRRDGEVLCRRVFRAECLLIKWFHLVVSGNASTLTRIEPVTVFELNFSAQACL